MSVSNFRLVCLLPIYFYFTEINIDKIRYWYFMLHSLTNVKISNKDFNWKKKRKKKKKVK
jgi:hypothetical protein